MQAAQQNTVELIIISDAVYIGCSATRQIPDSKLLQRSIYDVLTQISNDFQRLICHVQTLAVAAWRDSTPVKSGVHTVLDASCFLTSLTSTSYPGESQENVCFSPWWGLCYLCCGVQPAESDLDNLALV